MLRNSQRGAEGTGANMTGILAAINNLKAEFSSKFEVILTAIEISRCSKHVTQAEMWISTMEDYLNAFQEKVINLEGEK